MSDPRVETVAAVLREAGVQTNLDDTDTLATKLVNALDREHGAPATAGDTATEDAADREHANPETPVGNATEGGTAASAQ
jgi:Arc/MetJ family transcription regulator